MKDGGRYKMAISQDANAFYVISLEISNVLPTDEGEYKAVAKNQHGEGSTTIHLNFEGSGRTK